jgi:hypothetical protein
MVPSGNHLFGETGALRRVTLRAMIFRFSISTCSHASFFGSMITLI